MGLTPVTLQHKEALDRERHERDDLRSSRWRSIAQVFTRTHALVTAWNSFLLRGQAAHFDERRLFAAKPHPGAIAYAGHVRAAPRVRAAPGAQRRQGPGSVLGALRAARGGRARPEVLEQAAATVAIELNGAGDNPLMCEETGARPYTAATSTAATCARRRDAQAPGRARRRDPRAPARPCCATPPRPPASPNLVRVDGPGKAAHHGFKAVEILASSLVAEALKLAAPASVFLAQHRGPQPGQGPDGLDLGPRPARDPGRSRGPRARDRPARRGARPRTPRAAPRLPAPLRCAVSRDPEDLPGDARGISDTTS
ncbi:MAG: aromatic amino acid lyase [Myxococcales bacterium]|nr:aromatic amino acid lyase [Myxococcales bacterium]